VLRGAAEVILERGLERTRYVDIATASRVPTSTLQHAFGTLGSLCAQALELKVREELAALSAPREGQASTPAERLTAIIAGMFGPDGDRAPWLMWLELWRGAAHDNALRERAGDAFGAWIAMVAAVIEDGRGAGDFSADLSAEEFAIALFGLAAGMAFPLVAAVDRAAHTRAVRVATTATFAMLRP
jgi:AcrR family transcriptional regulator